ncbi:hypothetical protein FXO37_04892 [Capsicum annuum]|nr:hypothetical protein FXO37_04892 [Capsicum annuum]
MGPKTGIPQECEKEALAMNRPIILKSKEVVEEVKEPLPIEIQEEQRSILPYQVHNKGLSEDKSVSSHGDRCWKKVRQSLEEPSNANMHVVEIFGDNIISLRTLIAMKEVRRKVKKFKSLLDVVKENSKEIESKASADKEFSKCADISLPTENALNDVEKKKQGLKASLHDLFNYKLCLD